MAVAAPAPVDTPAERPAPRWSGGPGLVHLLGAINPNDIVANSMVGATYGYSMLWVLVIAYGLNYFIADACARYVLATGESIVEGYGRLGRPVVLALAGAIFVRRHLNNLFLVLLLGSSLQLLVPAATAGAGTAAWTLASCAVAFWLMFRGYHRVEGVSRWLLTALGLAWAIVAVLARPAPGRILHGLLVPSAPGPDGVYGSFVLLMALAGTTVGSINHLKYPAFVYERGWRRLSDLPRQRVDLAVSVTGQLVLAVLIQVAAAATLYGHGVHVRSLAELSSVFSTPLGAFGRIVLAVGLWVTVLNNYLGSNTGYGLLVADVFERFGRRRPAGRSRASRDAARRRLYRAILTFFCVSPMYVLFTSWEPVRLGIVTSAMFLVLTPLIMGGLLWLTNDRARMKGRANGLLSQLAIAAAVIVSCYLTWQGAFELIARWRGPA